MRFKRVRAKGSTARSAARRPASKKSTIRRADLTRPTPRHERILPRFVGRIAIVIGVLVVAGSFLNSFLVLPVSSWFGQEQEIGDRQAELDALRSATDQLQTEVDRLNTEDGVRDAARDELGYVMVGEDQGAVVGESDAPTDLPTGWPYDLVERIVQLREVEAAADASP